MIVNDDDDDLFDYTFSKKDSVSFIISLYLQESNFKNLISKIERKTIKYIF